MVRFAYLILSLGWGLGIWGCATSEPARVAPPREEPKVFYYVNAMDLTLRSAPDPAASDTGRVALNAQVEQLQRKADWFQVRTSDGLEGWANERYLALRPVAELYVRRWVRLKADPAGSSKTVARLRPNDRVNLLEQNSQGWARVSAERAKSTGWLELKYLSLDRVPVRRVRRTKASPAKPGEEEAVPSDAQVAPEPSILGPTPAQAAPPPAQKAPARPKTRPELFEPF
jgi:SH3-like domain-containing protein